MILIYSYKGGDFMKKKLKILILVKQFGDRYAKHKPKFDFLKALENHAEVYYWYKDGHISLILRKLNIQPDFILHYDIAWNHALAPKIDGLDKITIPKGCFIYDIHYDKKLRKDYIDSNKIDIIFSTTKHPFLNEFPEYKKKFRWLPWSVNPNVIKDWKLKKDIDYLLLGQVYQSDYPNKTQTPKGRYPFRDAVYVHMRNMPNFVFHPHPGHRVHHKAGLLVNERYAQEINRSKIFFTCGSILNYSVMKFFEGPGCRSLLLAETNRDIIDLGFQDGVHYVACNQSNFLSKANYYLENEKERKRITDNGYKLIHSKHTNDVRAQECIEFITDYIHSRTGKE